VFLFGKERPEKALRQDSSMTGGIGPCRGRGKDTQLTEWRGYICMVKSQKRCRLTILMATRQIIESKTCVWLQPLRIGVIVPLEAITKVAIKGSQCRKIDQYGKLE
jgi:hypothetical protein